MVFQDFKSMLVRPGEFPFKLFALTIILRLFDLVLIRSSYVPDEYWQSLEVAHREVFGYGHLTWEWNQGIRSCLYVSFISSIYYLLKFLQMDTAFLVVWAPRLLQGVISALSDVYFVRWVHEKRYRQHSWAFFSLVTSYFISYCSTRTLINTIEMNLTTIALYYYPWTPERNNKVFTALVFVLFFLRPTSMVIWLPFVLMNILSVRRKFMYVVKSYVTIGLMVSGLCVLLDSHFYGRWILTPWEFFSFNVLRDVSSFYGTHNYFWYFYVGIPIVLGIQTLPFYYNMINILRDFFKKKRQPKYDPEQQVAIVLLWALVVFSFIPHKEFRFLLPLMPLMLFISSSVWSKWSARAKLSHIYILAFLFIIINLCVLLFLGQFHQVGKLDAMKYLSNEVKERQANILFLTPCHSTPLYSHLHYDVPIKFITCEPNVKGAESYVDESEEFFNNSMSWIKKEYDGKPMCKLPSHIMMFNTLNITSFLKKNNFDITAEFFDSYFYPDREGSFINIYKRDGIVCSN